MPAAVKLREDYSAEELRALARRSKDARQSRRLLSLAAVRDGMDCGEAAKIGGMDRQTLRDWVHRFNDADQKPSSTIGRAVRSRASCRISWPSSPGSSRRVRIGKSTAWCAGADRSQAGHRRALRRRLPRPLCRQASQETRLFPHSRQPRHPAQDERIVEAYKKLLARAERSSRRPAGDHADRDLVPDEARIGQKNGLVRQWARRGTRPRQPADQRYVSAYLFGAICPGARRCGALAMPFADTQPMQLHLEEISQHVAEDAHAVLLLHRAGWHTTDNSTSPATSPRSSCPRALRN